MAGGADRYVADLATRLVDRGHVVDVVCPKASPLLKSCELRDGVTVNRFKNFHGPFWFNWLAENLMALFILAKLNRRGEEMVVVLCHSFLWPAVWLFRKQTLFSFHGPWAEEYRSSQKAVPRSKGLQRLDQAIASFMQSIEHSALDGCREVLVVSEFSRRMLPNWHPGFHRSVVVVGAGVSLETFQIVKDRTQMREVLGIEQGDFLLLTVRRLAPRMGLMTLVEAMRRAVEIEPRLKLTIAGKGVLESALREQITKLGLEKQIRLFGYVPESQLPALYSAADCSVIPSTELEGFGLSALESLACGTAVIASDLGGLPEILEPLSPTLLITPGSAQELSEKLVNIARGDEPLPSSKACRDYVEMRFNWGNTVRGFEKAARRMG